MCVYWYLGRSSTLQNCRIYNLHGGLLLVEVVCIQGGIAKVGLGVQDGLHLLQQLLQLSQLPVYTSSKQVQHKTEHFRTKKLLR